jgi:hypothetical protein
VHDPSWRQNIAEIAQPAAGYYDGRALRPPFLEVPDPVKAQAWRQAGHSTSLRERCRRAAVGAGG